VRTKLKFYEAFAFITVARSLEPGGAISVLDFPQGSVSRHLPGERF
jgi:hypothetical protein